LVVHLKILIIIAGVASAIYASSLRNSFHFDDQHYIVGNSYIRDISNIPYFFTSPRYSSFEKIFSGHYRPLLVTSYALNYAAGGLSPLGYHVVNLIFHIGSAFLVYLISRSLLGVSLSIRQEVGIDKVGPMSPSIVTSAIAGLIFAVHPFNSEVVNYITARSSVMCAFFYLLSFYCWVRYRESRKGPQKSSWRIGDSGYGGSHAFYIASFLSFVLSILTKEIAVTLPSILLLYDLYFYLPEVTPSVLSHKQKGEIEDEGPPSPLPARYRIWHPDGRLSFGAILHGVWQSIPLYLPYILLVILPYLSYRFLLFGRLVNIQYRDYYTNLLTQPKVLIKYLSLLLFPSGLTIDHDITLSTTISDTHVLASIVLLSLFLITAFFLYKRGREWRVLSFFIIWFFITLLPTTIIPLNAILQENRGYLAGIVFPIFAGSWAGRLCSFAYSGRVILNLRGKSILIVTGFLLFILISIYSFLTIQRNAVWKSDYTLWSDAVEKAPGSARAHDNLGLAYIEEGKYELALEEFGKTLKLNPRYYLAYYNAGVVYQLQNKLNMARDAYEACLRINPGYFRACYNLGIVYKGMGEIDRAIEVYEKAISIDPRHPFVYNNLGVALAEKGRLDRAIDAFKKAIEADPNYEKAHFNLGNMYYKTGKYDLAVEAYRSALHIKPDYREAGEMLREVMAKLRQGKDLLPFSR